MTDVKIIEWAKKCGWDNPATNMAPLYEFAKLVAQHEREACAKEADKRLYDYTMLTSNPPQNGAAWSIANAIRARGQRTPEGGKA